MRYLLTVAVAASSLFTAAPSTADVGEVRIAQLYGISYLPLMIMQHDRLLEKQAAKLGVNDLKVSWTQFSGANVSNEAIISGSLDFASGGVPAFATLWAKTRQGIDVRAVGAMNAMPLYLNTRNPNIKSIRDFGEKDRIALPAVKVSAQSIVLQMAAEQSFGAGQHDRLDALTVGLSHPDGMTALLSGKGEIESHFTAPPFQYQELDQPGVRRVLSSYHVLGGPAVFTVAYTSNKFREANPRVYEAFVAALDEAIAKINSDKSAAAQIYLDLSKDKSSVDQIVKMLNDPEIEFSTTPKNIMKQVGFMHRIGSIKVNPASWKELFFPNAHDRPGS